MARYVVSHGRITVTARSSIHDTTCVWSEMSGTIDFDPDEPGEAQAEVKVDMRAFDAGDRLKNWKLRGDIQPDKYPEAVFTLARLDGVTREGDKLSAGATGSIAWRGRNAEIAAKGAAVATEQKIEATAEFELNVRKVGVEPPKILMFKVDEVVLVKVELTANALLA
jgi:polyisoprenoid-binding protein YceI